MEFGLSKYTLWVFKVSQCDYAGTSFVFIVLSRLYIYYIINYSLRILAEWLSTILLIIQNIIYFLFYIDTSIFIISITFIQYISIKVI